QTLTPTGYWFGPLVGLLLSRPTMFQVIGVMVSVAAACAGAAGSSHAHAARAGARAKRTAGDRRPNITRSSLNSTPHRSIVALALPQTGEPATSKRGAATSSSA